MSLFPRRITTLAAALAASTLFLGACGSGGGEASPSAAGGGQGGTITSAVAYSTTNFHPSSTSSALALGTNWHVMEGLYELDMSDYTPYKALAAAEDPKEISPTEYEVALREGAKFSDGSEVTAQDVVRSFERAMDPGNIYQQFLGFIDSVQAKDDKTVTIKLTAPFELLKERLAIVKIVPATASDDELTSLPMGTGPYKYESITDTEIRAVPNENYNGDRPAQTSALVWDVLVDDTARTTAAQSGSADIIENVPADNTAMLESAGMTVAEEPGFNLPFLLFNTSKKPFDDARVRQAFHYAIDKQLLVDNNMSGKATVATSFLPEDHPNYHKASTQYDHDPDHAKKLLAEAGVKDLSITLLTTDHTWITSLAPQIKNDLEKVGVKVNIQSQASASLYADNLDVDKANYDVVLAPGDPSVFGADPALLIDWWYGDNVWTQKRSFLQESDHDTYQKINDLVQESVQVTGAEQQKKWDEAMDVIAEQAVLYPLFHRTMITGYNAEKISDFKPISTTGLWMLGAKASE